MSNAFNPIELHWKKQKFIIPANRVLRTIAIIEEVLPLDQVILMAQTEKVSISKISMAYAAVLRSAGCQVTDEDLYASLVGIPGVAKEAVQALQELLLLMIPRNLVEGGSETPPSGKSKSKRVRSNSSSKRTRASSSKADAPRISSGN